MRYLISILLSSSLLFTPIAMSASTDTIVEMQTNLGTIMIQLNQTKAPISSKNFLAYISNGFYKNTIFHRVIKGFMIQGGGVDKATMQFKTNTLSPIKLESYNGLKNVKGTIAMARTSVADSATSQFFINTVDNSFLDYTTTNAGYAVFGTVIKGLNIVTNIENALNSSSIYSSSNVPFINDELIYIDNVYSSANLDNVNAKTRITLNGSGSVASTPTGLSCGTTCVLSKPKSGTLKLTATPATGYAFSKWRGDCAGDNATITLDLTKGNHNCTAVFSKAPAALQ